MELKRCKKCGELRPIEDFRWQPGRKSRRHTCHKCELAYLNQYKKITKKDPTKTWFWCCRAVGINNAAKTRYGITNKVYASEIRNKFQAVSTCWLCGNPITIVDGWIDHIVPLSRNGSHTIDNLELFCKPCNELKNTFLLSELFERIILILNKHDKLP